jgi:MFS family permease
VYWAWYVDIRHSWKASRCFPYNEDLTFLSKIPAVLADRYARINHGFTDHCRNFAIKPPECKAGSDDAQSAAAWSHVALSAFQLLINPIVSALSDVHGRKPVILGAVLLSCIPAAVFYQILVEPKMNPFWYYVSSQAVLMSINNFLMSRGLFLFIIGLILRFPRIISRLLLVSLDRSHF